MERKQLKKEEIGWSEGRGKVGERGDVLESGIGMEKGRKEGRGS